MRQRKVKKKKKRIIGVIFAVIAIGISCFALVIQNDKDEEEKEYDRIKENTGGVFSCHTEQIPVSSSQYLTEVFV